MNDKPAVLTRIDGSVATVTLNRPEKRNAINGDVVDGLKQAFLELEADTDLRVILLRGEGIMFSSGIDATWLGQLAGLDDTGKMGVYLRILINRIQEVNNLIERVEKPVVAVLHGRCIGLGLEIALACDFRIAAEDTLIGLPEVVLGLVPDCGGTTRVTRFAGPAVAKEIIMLCENLPAVRYHQWNLINRVCPASELDRTVKEFTDILLDRPPRTLGVVKRLIDRGAGLDKMSHMEMESMANSALVTVSEFPQILMEGFGKLRKK